MASPEFARASDRAIVRAARKGDERAYGELMRRYQGKVRRSIYRIVHHTERTKELTQDAFLKAFRSLDRYRSERHFAPWLLAIAKNWARNSMAKRRFDSANLRGAPLEEVDRAGLVSDPWSYSHQLPARQRDLRTELEDAIDQLPPARRRCVILAFQEGRTYEEIAAETGMRLGTVKSHISRAKQALREILERSDGSS